MKRLDRYLARTIWMSILLVLLVIVGIDALSAFIDETGRRSAAYDFRQIGVYVLLTLPGRCYEFIPFAALIGALIGLGQLASCSELVVMRAAGISNLRLARTALVQALLLALLGFLIGEYLAPAAEQKAQSGRALALYADRQSMGQQGVWRRDGGLFLHVQAMAPDRRIYGVTAYDFDREGWLERIIFADRGRYRRAGWSLSDVQITHLEPARVRGERRDAIHIASNITPRILSLETVSPAQLSLMDLLSYAEFLRRQGEDTAEFELATWRKLLQPAAVAALVLVAIAFVFGPLRDGTLGFRLFTGVMLGVLFRLAQDLLGPASLVFGFAPLYAAILPVLLCVLVGLLLLRRAG